MKKIYFAYKRLPRRLKDSMLSAISAVGVGSTIMSIIGISINDWTNNIWYSVGIIMLVFVMALLLVYACLGVIFGDSICINIRKNNVIITKGDIFKATGWKVIGCDSKFDLRIDDIIISKKSLHGQFVLNHAKKRDLKNTIEKEAKRLKLEDDGNGYYSFPLGTIVPYKSSVDNETYLLLAMANLNEQNEVHTSMAQYEQMLMKMWKEIDRVYSMNDITLPVLGTGITRFDEGPKENSDLLRCMLCTLNSSGVNMKSNIKIVIYGNTKNYNLYEYKDMF